MTHISVPKGINCQQLSGKNFIYPFGYKIIFYTVTYNVVCKKYLEGSISNYFEKLCVIINPLYHRVACLQCKFYFYKALKNDFILCCKSATLLLK